MSLKISICIPVYKGSDYLGVALKSILSQNFFELLISDDNHIDDKDEIEKTEKIIENFSDRRIKYFKTERNLGYARNLKWIVSKAQGDIAFLFAQDDILAKGALQKVHDAFLDSNVGVVSRPYFWFDSDISKPIREVRPYGLTDIEMDANNPEHLVAVVNSIGQLSGLAYRIAYLENDFSDECFVAHVYPFLSIFKKYKCVYLADYTVAVRITSSQTRFLPSIYEISPTESWIRMIKKIFTENEFKKSKKAAIKHTATRFVGLLQLKNYAKFKYLVREFFILVKYRPVNLVDLRFWFFVIGTLIASRFILRSLVDWYKENINSKRISRINFDSAG